MISVQMFNSNLGEKVFYGLDREVKTLAITMADSLSVLRYKAYSVLRAVRGRFA